jgi:hypothetical protein
MPQRTSAPLRLALVIVLLMAACHPTQAPEPVISVLGGLAAQHQRLDEALARFENVGLKLPDLVVVISDDDQDCEGQMGLFDPTPSPWRITICTSADFIYEHELAHAWERANLTDQDRRAFMSISGHNSWADPGDAWIDRGVEGVAFIIQQGLLTRPLAHPPSREISWRMELFEVLTGRPSPRLGQ